MPPKAKVTREMILDAAFGIARESGIESVNARTIAGRIGCSTQPVLYSFATVDDIRRATYNRAEEYHTEFLEAAMHQDLSMLSTGMAYIRFAAKEKYLFRLLFQSNHFSQQSLDDVVGDESASPLLGMLSAQYGIDREQAKEAFTARFLMVHGMASMLANNSMIYDEDAVVRLLKHQFSVHKEK